MKDLKGREMRPYNQAEDVPSTGWTNAAVQEYLRRKHRLYVDDERNIWADNGDVLGRIEK